MTDETRATSDEAAETLKAAEALGTDHGAAAGSWVVDGNSSTETLLAVLRLADEGELTADLSGPLSGEFADGMTLGRLADELGVDEESEEFPDLCDAYEAAYYSAYEAEAVRSARGMLPEGYAVKITNSDGSSRTFTYATEAEAEAERRAFLLAGLDVENVEKDA